MPFITIFLYGALASAFALIFELILQVSANNWNQSSTLTPIVLLSLLILALIEETSKYLFLRQYADRYINPAPSPQGIKPCEKDPISIHPHGKTTGYSRRCWINAIASNIGNILLLGLAFGIGFSLLETILSSGTITNIAVFPTLCRSILHIGTSIILTYFMLRPSAPLNLKNGIWLLASVTLVHTIYNVFFL